MIEFFKKRATQLHSLVIKKSLRTTRKTRSIYASSNQNTSLYQKSFNHRSLSSSFSLLLWLKLKSSFLASTSTHFVLSINSQTTKMKSTSALLKLLDIISIKCEEHRFKQVINVWWQNYLCATSISLFVSNLKATFWINKQRFEHKLWSVLHFATIHSQYRHSMRIQT